MYGRLYDRNRFLILHRGIKMKTVIVYKYGKELLQKYTLESFTNDLPTNSSESQRIQSIKDFNFLQYKKGTGYRAEVLEDRKPWNMFRTLFK